MHAFSAVKIKKTHNIYMTGNNVKHAFWCLFCHYHELNSSVTVFDNLRSCSCPVWEWMPLSWRGAAQSYPTFLTCWSYCCMKFWKRRPRLRNPFQVGWHTSFGWDDKPKSSVCTHSEHQARTIKILQSLCVSHKIVETYRNQHALRSRDERKRAEKMWNMNEQ
jgi:hypothetical protein